MNTKERAEKVEEILSEIRCHTHKGRECECLKSVEWIAAQIEEACKEARFKALTSEDPILMSEFNEHYEKGFQEALSKTKLSYELGFHAAREKASKIADMKNREWDNYLLENAGKGKKLVNLNNFIADRIRKMEP